MHVTIGGDFMFFNEEIQVQVGESKNLLSLQTLDGSSIVKYITVYYNCIICISTLNKY